MTAWPENSFFIIGFCSFRCAVVEIPRKYSLEIDEGYDLVLARAMLPFIDP